MQTTTQNRSNHPAVAPVFWLVVGVIVLIASGDAFALIVAATAIVTLIWAMVGSIQRRVRNRARLASVTHLRPPTVARTESSAGARAA